MTTHNHTSLSGSEEQTALHSGSGTGSTMMTPGVHTPRYCDTEIQLFTLLALLTCLRYISLFFISVGGNKGVGARVRAAGKVLEGNDIIVHYTLCSEKNTHSRFLLISVEMVRFTQNFQGMFVGNQVFCGHKN